jgi:hypothetical protein
VNASNAANPAAELPVVPRVGLQTQTTPRSGKLQERVERVARRLPTDATPDVLALPPGREAYALVVTQADAFGIPREEVGDEPDLILERDLLLDPPHGYFAG